MSNLLFLDKFKSFLMKHLGYKNIGESKVSIIKDKNSSLIFSLRKHEYYIGKYNSSYNKDYKKHLDQNNKRWFF